MEETRIKALELAVASKGHDNSAKQVVERAKEYYDFLAAKVTKQETQKNG